MTTPQLGRPPPTDLPYGRHPPGTRPERYVSAQHEHVPRPVSHHDMAHFHKQQSSHDLGGVQQRTRSAEEVNTLSTIMPRS